MSNRTQNWAAAVGALAAVIGVLLALGVISPFGESAVVPVVTGLEQVPAVAQLEAAGFEVSAESVVSADVAAGRVISTAPAGGATAARGSIVRMLVSTGAVPPLEPISPNGPSPNGTGPPAGILVAIPDLSQVSQAEAAARLDALGLGAAVVSEPSGSIPQGAVIRTEPPAGAPVLRGSVVRLVVSSGDPGGPDPGIDVALILDDSTCPIVPGDGPSAVTC